MKYSEYKTIHATTTPVQRKPKNQSDPFAPTRVITTPVSIDRLNAEVKAGWQIVSVEWKSGEIVAALLGKWTF